MALLVIPFLLAVQFSAADSKHLVFVHAIWRHGDRTPINPMPADPYNPPQSWPQGLGELWTNGVDEQYELGDVLRKRYQVDQAYMNNSYDQSQIYVRSTDYNRTLMSATATMAGFYSNASKSSTNLKWAGVWQTVPVHTIPANQDYLLRMTLDCKQAEEIKKSEVLNSKEYLDNVTHFQDLFNYLNQYKMHSKVDLNTVWEVDDHLGVAKQHGRKWPDFINESNYEMIKNASATSAMFLYNNDKIQRFRGAPLIAEIANRMVMKRASLTTSTKEPEQQWIRQLKMYAYSAHDVTIMAVLENLGEAAIADGALPSLSSCLVFELYQDGDQFHVLAFYRHGPAGLNFVPVKIKGCSAADGISCPLDTFYNQFKDRPPKDWCAECAGGSSRILRINLVVILLGAFQAILLPKCL